jgi:hypothetical protein
VNRIPIYQACLFLGAISPDHKNLNFTPGDALRYYPNNPALRRMFATG